MHEPPLSGFKFRIYGTSTGGDALSSTADGNGTISYVAVTDANGVATFEHIPVGTYTLKEDLSTQLPNNAGPRSIAYVDASTPKSVTIVYSD